MKALCLQAGSKSGSEQIPDIYYIPETSWHGIDCAGWLSYFQEEYTGDVQIMGIKGLSGVGADNSTDCTVEVEFRPVQEDSLSYLFMTFRYDEMGWTISSYGLEK